MLFSREKNNEFFDLFILAAANAHRASELIIELGSYPDRAVELVGAIRELEHRGDEYTRSTHRLLVRSFITPLDREDIHRIAASLDDVLDGIEALAMMYHLLKITKPVDEYMALARLLERSLRKLKRAFEYLQQPKREPRIQVVVRQVGEIEGEGDSVHQRLFARLLNEEKDPVVIMKWKHLCDFLEDGLNSTHEVAHALESVLLKHM